jgi:tetratricopeptide (TPR) repeat protein
MLPTQKQVARSACALLALGCVSLLRAWGQEVRLEDIPASGAQPQAYKNLPLDARQLATLQEATKSHDYARAESLLVEEIQRHPKTPELLSVLGGIFFLDGKYLNSAVALKKADAIALLANRDRFTLAMSYITLNHRDWARPELEKLAHLDPRNPLYPYWLGRLDYDAMKFQAAEAHLEKALELDPAFMKAYDNLGLSYEALGQFEEAVRVYKKAILLNRALQLPSPWPPVNLGTLLVKLGKLEEAENCLEESLHYDPRFPVAHYQMGMLREKQARDDEALQELNLAAQNDPAYPEPHYILGRIYQRIGNKAKAEEEWQTFQKLKKETPRERPH